MASWTFSRLKPLVTWLRPLRRCSEKQLWASSTAVGGYATARHNCTHMFDLAGLVVAHTQRDAEERQYDFEATDWTKPDLDNRFTVWRDGEQVLHQGPRRARPDAREALQLGEELADGGRTEVHRPVSSPCRRRARPPPRPRR